MIDRVQKSHRVLLDAWDALAYGSAAAESVRGGLIEIAWCGLPVSFFNLALTSRTPASIAEFEAALQQTCSWASTRQHGWILALSHETMGDLLDPAKAVLEGQGFAPMMPLTGMEATELLPPAREVAGVEWLTETAPDLGGTVLRLNEAAYELQFAEPGTLPMERADWWDGQARMASVLVADGEPASSTAVISVDGLRYVALVASPPAKRGRGYAEAAMRHVLNRALAAGCRAETYLHATAAGRPIYARMGYQPTAEYTLYVKMS
ncbi:MAG: GNAT family N-acetyltransferase [Acidobacteria bacterium]|nr:GNAT family N-acetyltransferase [Acidobacteriota bacterium]